MQKPIRDYLASLGVAWSPSLCQWTYAGQPVSEYDLYLQLVAAGYPVVVRSLAHELQEVKNCAI